MCQQYSPFPMKHLFFYLFCLLALLHVAGCGDRHPAYVIGVSQCSDDDWRTQLNMEICREAQFYPNVSVEVRTANDDSRQQIRDIDALTARDVDVLVVSPNVVDDITPAIDRARNKGIPVILVDRRTRSQQGTAYVGADNYDIGRQAGEYIAHRLQGKGKMVEITGLSASTPAIERHKGMMDVLQGYPDIQVVAQADAGWLENRAETVFDSLLHLYPHIDLVFAHNDRMAAGAYHAALRQGREKGMLLIGVDALPGEGRGVDMVARGQLDATFIYPTGGDKVVQVAMDILQGKPYEHENMLSTALVNKANARIMQMQTTHIATLDHKIETLNSLLDSSLMRYSLQRMLLVTCAIILALAMILLFFVVRAFWTKKRMNATLEQQKQALETQKGQLEQQRDQLIALSEQVQKATRAKLMFFTNVSHDFRTPLTLIVDPVNQLLQAPSSSLTGKQRDMLQMVQRNTAILLNLVNQLLDFRKFEEGKLSFCPGNFNLPEALRQWAEAFRPLTYRKHIHLEIQVPDDPACTITADAEKLERIVYNLLSNAFKYTPENGTVRISLTCKDNDAVIQVSDTGTGIAAKDQDHIFDSFYQADMRHGGSGIGLALAKAFVDIHHGHIAVQSETGKGSTFTVSIPMTQPGYTERATGLSNPPSLALEAPVAGVISPPTAPSAASATGHEETLLVIDDNPDIRTYVRLSLEKEYNILEASNGQEGLRLAMRQMPDVIICDVMMPMMDGMECCRRLKSELQTSHIPVIMLTAYSQEEQKIQGYECGADSYLAKPFSANLLTARIRNLIDNRHRLQDLFAGNPEWKQAPIGQIDKTFLEKLHEQIEKNLSDPDFSVEALGAQIGLSRVQLYRKCKALTNYAPNELLRITRLKRAATLLAATEKSVSEIAYEVGFSSPSYFAKCYKEYFGKSPTKDIKQQ